jgi:hypothetical protein
MSLVTACQHCPAELTRTGNGVWVDERGFPACVKAPLASLPAAPGQPFAGVLHAPMPLVPYPPTPAACPACGSGDPAEPWYVPGGTGQPVTCCNDWHDR